MKKLIFVRHGKAEDANPEFSDFDRSLTTKGKVITRQMAHEFKEQEKTPGLLVSSPAFRAIETALIFASELGISEDKILMFNDIYYKMTFNSLVRMVSSMDDETDTVTLFGHNPSFSEITNSLCKNGCEYLPKSAVAAIAFKITSWSDIRRKTGNLEYFLKP
jgi:phosphohistidine phosphatase